MNLREIWTQLRAPKLRGTKLRARAQSWIQRRREKGLDAQAIEATYRQALDNLYSADDPFRMASPKEQYRFAQTNQLLRQAFIAPRAKVGSLLEIGCGEGHQSLALAELCEQLTGIDVVPVAVERARSRLPAATLIAGDLRDQPWAEERGRFDLVTACEVIYYFHDIPRMLALMSRLGRGCLVTYHLPAAHLVEGPLNAMPVAGRATFAFEEVEWRAAWWHSP